MAVEIPVVIDIEGAFDEAAKKVDTAIRPLKRKIDDATASLELTVGFDESGGALKKTVKQITDITKLLNGKVKLGASIGEVSKALDDARSRYANLEALRSKGASIDLNRLNSLREAIIILTQELEQRTRIVELVSEEANRQIRVNRAIEGGEYAMIREAKTIAEINEKISALRGKLENIDPKSKEWTNTAKEIRSATNELAKFEEKFKNILGGSSTSKAGSINRMSEDMRKLEDRWNSMSATMKFDKDGRLKASAQKIVDKYKELSSQAEKTGKSLRDMTRPPREELEKFNATATKTSATMRQLTSYATSFVSVWSVASFMKRIRETTAEFELQEVALGGILQNTVKAHSLFEQIKAAAVKSPFFVKDIVTYTKQLSAYRIETDKLFDVTMQLADVSAGLGVDMNRLILAYGQVRAASVLRGQELRQFTEAGVPLVELLADKFTELRGTMVSTADVFKLISERAVPFSMIEEIFNDMTSAGGMFYKMQEKQAETLAGRWNNLKDSIAIAMDEMGRTDEMRDLFNAMIELAKRFMKGVTNLVKNIKTLAITFASVKVAMALFGNVVRGAYTQEQLLARQTNKTNAAMTAWWASLSTGQKILRRFGMILPNITRLVRGFWAALKANPLGIITSAIGGIVGAFEIFGSKTEEHEDIGDIGAFIANAEKRHKEMNELADTYDKLSAKQELNEREQKQLAAVTNELAKAYHGKAMEIDEATGKIKINTKEVRKLSKEEKEARKLQLKSQKKRIEDYNESNEARLKYLSAMLKWEQERDLTGKSTAEIARERASVLKSTGLTAKQIKKIEDWLDGGDLLDAMNKVTEWLDTGREQMDEIDRAFDELGPKASDLNGWQRAIVDVQDEYAKTGALFSRITDEQLKNFSTLDGALFQFAKDWKDVSNSIKPTEEALESLQSQLDALNALDTFPAIGMNLYQAMVDTKNDLELMLANKGVYEKIFALFGVDPNELLKKRNGGHTAYTQDPYIKLLDERMKFMKDFEKGYRDLEKYMGRSGALEKEAQTMLARGSALGLSASDQRKAAEELSSWYQGVIDDTFAYLKNEKGVTGTLDGFLSQQIKDTSNRGKMLKDFQKLIQSMYDAKTDYDTKNFEDGIKRALKIAADKISRSEEARNFYNDILGLTGDVELAAQISFGLYGGSGEELEERINNALANILSETEIVKDVNLFGLLMGTFKSRDMVAFNKALDDLGDEYSEVVKQLRDLSSEYTKFYKTQTTDLLKALEAAKTYGEERVKIERDTMRREEQINGLNDVSEEKKEQLRLRNRKKAAEEVAKAEYEVFKNSPMYVQMFSDLDGASTRMLENMRDRLISVQAYWKDLSATELKELQARLTEIDNALANRNPFRAFSRALQERRDAISSGKGSRKADEERARIARAEADEQVRLLDAMLAELDALKKKHGTESDIVKSKEKEVDAQQQETDAAIEAANAAEKQALKWNDVVNGIKKAAEGAAKYADEINEIVDSTQKIFDVFASQENSELFGNYAQGLKDLTSGAANIAKGLTGILTGTDVFGGSVKLLSGIADVVSGIWGTSSRERIRKADKDIKEQQRLIDNLKESYDRLGDAMAKSFGSDYIYNFQTQLKLLEAQAAAYRKQADAERGKGKKADADAVREYEKSAREVEQQIKDMRDGLSSFFTGTDVTSAAKDFASAWLDAYRSFSSTTGTMKEKFQDLVQEMVINSLAAKMVQSILGPWFEQIDNMAKSGGILDANEISQIAAETGGYVDVINAALTNLMNELAGAGLNMREKVGSLTGIKREIGGATEETMSAVAVGLNTQNFYLSFVPGIGADVAAIREALTGESSVTRSSVNVSSSGFGDDVFRGQMSRIDENIMEIRALLKSVISPRGTTASTHSVSVKY